MAERGQGRFDRSRYGTGGDKRSSASQARDRNRERDSFYDDMRISAADPHAMRTVGDYSRQAAEAQAPDTDTVSRKRRGGRKRRTGLVIGIVVAVVVLVGAGAAFAYFSSISNNLHEGVDEDLKAALVQTDMANEPFYMLLLGTDGSYQRDTYEDYGGQYRSDSMMLARIDAVDKKVALISISRDILTDLGEYGEEKINSAYALGGPALAVQAVSKLANVPISHYAQVDFDGFSAMVDALGGVDVDVPIDIDDWEAGGSLSAGQQTLNGEQALILCRSRNAYADVSAKPDEMRTANQRLVLSAIAKKMLSADIATIAGTVQAMSKYVTTDLELTDIIGLAQAMKGLDPDSSVFTGSVPTTSEYIDGGWYEFVNKADWAAMMKRVDAGEPPLEEAVVDEATGTVMATAGAGTTSSAQKLAVVTVKNATETAGLASGVRSKLMEAGFVNVVVGEVTDGSDYPETLILYDESTRAREAAEIASVIGQGRVMKNDGSYLLMDTDFIVVIGDDWKA